MSGAASGLTRLERALPALERLAGVALRVWREDGERLQAVGGTPPSWQPALEPRAGAGRALETPEGAAWFEPVREAQGLWLEIRGGNHGGERPPAASLSAVIGALVEAEREANDVATELSGRYEEIDLIYTISEILGHTIRLDEAARRILREVANVVRARRASLFVLDDERRILKLIAAEGMDAGVVDPIEVDDRTSITARAFRDMRIVSRDPADPATPDPGGNPDRNYRGAAYLSVPVLYASPGGQARPIGVINLTDRKGEDTFKAGDRKLIAAIANQIGAALENARLVAREQSQLRLRRELELAHDLQLKLLPAASVLAGKADLAARCRPAESVGGDFYNLLRLHEDRVGVMIGDVSSHGFGAALIMALAMAASGIHAESAETPGQVIAALEESLSDELSRTEMFLSLFYAVIDPAAGTIAYANAGHAHAFLVRGASGESQRLGATRPPLGLGEPRGGDKSEAWMRRADLLCLFTDGIADALSEQGQRFGEDRVVAHVRRMRMRPAREILEAIFTDLAAFTGGGASADDRTLLVLKV